MRLSVFLFSVFCVALLTACSSSDSGSAEPASVTARSVLTSLDPSSCAKTPDLTDPNETPYLLCPGVAGYSLIVRKVASGRKSVDVVDPSKELHPLNFQETVTRYMSNLDGQAEWRVVTRNGQEVPIALIVRVQSHEDLDEPEAVSATYTALAKLTLGEVCVTDRISDQQQSPEQIRSIADSAPDRACALPQPAIGPDGQDRP